VSAYVGLWQSERQAPGTGPFPTVQMASFPDEGSPDHAVSVSGEQPSGGHGKAAQGLPPSGGHGKAVQGLPPCCLSTASPHLDHLPLSLPGPRDPRASAGGQSGKRFVCDLACVLTQFVSIPLMHNIASTEVAAPLSG